MAHTEVQSYTPPPAAGGAKKSGGGGAKRGKKKSDKSERAFSPNKRRKGQPRK
jgi:hypothetical protein